MKRSTSQSAAPGPVRREDAFDVEALTQWLTVHTPTGRTDVDVSVVPDVLQFSGGASNLTYLLRYAEGDLILRRPPNGIHHKGAHDVAREHRIQAQLARFLPYVPRTVALCEDPDVIGTPFYVMQRLDGLIARKNMPPELSLDHHQISTLCRNVIDVLVKLHAVDVDSTGLSELDRGQNYVRRQVDGWSQRYRRARTWNVGSFEYVMGWLTDHQPEDRPHTLVHNDFRFDNVILARSDPTQPIGLLDWELATVGDPFLDLANTLGYWVQADDSRLLKGFRRQPTHLPGMMTREEVIAYYCVQAGTTMTNRQWVWYQVFGLFRIAVIAQQIYQRYLSKQTTNKQFRSFGIAVVLFELRCRRIIAQAARMPAEIAEMQVGSPH